MMNSTTEEKLLAKIAELEKRLSEEKAKTDDARRRQKGAEQLAQSLEKRLDKKLQELDKQHQKLERKDRQLAEKTQKLELKNKKLAEAEKQLAEKAGLVVAFGKCVKEVLPVLKAFAEKLKSRMTDDPEWNQIIVKEFISALGQLDAIRHDCSVLKKRANQGGEKIEALAAVKEIESATEEAKIVTTRLVASAAHQVANANVVNGITVAALKEVGIEGDNTIDTMREIIEQKPSALLEERRKEESKKEQPIGRQKVEREDIPEEKIEAAELPSNLCCPYCGMRGKFIAIEQSQPSKMLSCIEDFVKVMKISVLGQTLAECPKCGTVQPIFTGPMALNPKREITIGALTSTVSLMDNGIPLNRIENIFFKDLQLGSSTLSENILQMAEYAEPLSRRIEEVAHMAPVAITDETPFDICQLEGRGHMGAKEKSSSEVVSSQTYIQAVTSPSATDKPFALFYVLPGRSKEEIAKVLNPFRSKIIMSDGYAAYTGIAKDSKNGVEHASCLVHWRRVLLKAANLETQVKYVKDTSAKQAIELCKKQLKEGQATPVINVTLYALSQIFAEEKSVVRRPDETYEDYLVRVKEHRDKYIVPLMDRIDVLMNILKDKAGLVAGKTGKYKNSATESLYYVPAVVYYLNRREELRHFLLRPGCPPSSNNVEALIRPITIIRNNINFLQSEKHARALCRLLSLLETAKLNGIENPTQWLTKYYYRIARHCQRKQWKDWTRPDAQKRKDPYKKFVSWEYEKYWDTMPIDDLLPWNYKPSED